MAFSPPLPGPSARLRRSITGPRHRRGLLQGRSYRPGSSWSGFMFAGRPVPTGLSNTSASSLPTKGGSPPCTLNGSQILHPLACILHLTFSTVHRQSSVLNLPSFHSSILPTAELILQKENSNNNSKQFPKIPLSPYLPLVPDSRGAKKTQLNAVYFELFQNNSPGD